MDTELTADRVAVNQSTFREANEQLEERADAIGVRTGALPFLCECPDRACTEIALLERADYERIRSRGDWFLAVPGHEVCVVDGVEIAKVIERNESFSLMEKIGAAKETALDLDPRS